MNNKEMHNLQAYGVHINILIKRDIV